MAEKPRPQYPAPALPEAASDQKLLGIYEQRQEGFLLQRIRVPGGRLTSEQWHAIADAADKVGARDALHLTTRQCVEVHGLTAATLPVLQAALADAGLSTVGAAGDTMRNVTVDPEAGLVPGTWELMPLADAITAAAESLPGIWGLPRKFKVSLSGSPAARMRPWMSDVGLIAAEDGSLTAIVAGSLGAKPATGVHLRSGLSVAEAIALTVAAVRLHAAEGDRENRRAARLRHVRERMGDAAFLDRLEALFAEEAAAPRAAAPEPSAAAAGAAHVRLGLPHGDLPIAVLRELLVTVERAGGELRIGLEHDLHLFGLGAADLPDAARPWSHAGRIVACPGTALCSKAAAPTYPAADALAALAADNPHALIAISGCPNSCAHAAVADVGLIGRVKRVGDERVVHYTVLTGGDAGAGPALAHSVGEPVPLAQLAEKVRALLGG